MINAKLHRKLKNVLRHVRERCTKPDHKYWKYYGGRGIKICDEWLHNNQSFYAWALSHGYQPGLELDRENNCGDYTPDNCRFVTKQVNQNNKRNNVMVTWRGETMNVTQWSNKLGVPSWTLRNRMRWGWTVDRMMETPARCQRAD